MAPSIDGVNGDARLVAAHTSAALFGIRAPTEHDLQTCGRMMAQQTSSGLEADSVQWMVVGLLVGSIDTTATAIINIVAEMPTDPAVARSMAAGIADDRRFVGWCYDLLRRRPHNLIVLRRTEAEPKFRDGTIAPNATVVAVTLAAMQDFAAFPRPAVIMPTRPLNHYMHFGYGLHVCIGQALNAIQIPLARELVRYAVHSPPNVRSRGPDADEFVVGLRGAG